MHHVYSQKKSKDDVEHQKKADTIVETVLAKMDKNKDGEIALEEFVLVGLDGLPNFDNLGAEGHHYDVESGAPSVWLCGRLLTFLVQNSSCIMKVCNVKARDICGQHLLYLQLNIHALHTTRSATPY